MSKECVYRRGRLRCYHRSVNLASRRPRLHLLPQQGCRFESGFSYFEVAHFPLCPLSAAFESALASSQHHDRLHRRHRHFCARDGLRLALDLPFLDLFLVPLEAPFRSTLRLLPLAKCFCHVSVLDRCLSPVEQLCSLDPPLHQRHFFPILSSHRCHFECDDSLSRPHRVWQHQAVVPILDILLQDHGPSPPKRPSPPSISDQRRAQGRDWNAEASARACWIDGPDPRAWP